MKATAVCTTIAASVGIALLVIAAFHISPNSQPRSLRRLQVLNPGSTTPTSIYRCDEVPTYSSLDTAARCQASAIPAACFSLRTSSWWKCFADEVEASSTTCASSQAQDGTSFDGFCVYPDDERYEAAEKVTSLEERVQGGGPLIPKLVTEGQEEFRVDEAWDIGNHYAAHKLTVRNRTVVEVPALNFSGSWSQKYFGYGYVDVTEGSTQLFRIREYYHTWDPRGWVGRFNFRILPANSENVEDSLMTIKKDYLGRGFALSKEEWRIYKGGQADEENLAYYCVGSFVGWSMKCYNSVREYNTGRNGMTVWGPPEVRDLPMIQPVAVLEESISLATVLRFTGLPDAKYVSLAPGADAALWLTFAMIIDTAHDTNPSAETLLPHVAAGPTTV